ncbi:CPBP family intramembrane glutamic endopeptidase [Nesterenkonia alba]|uniref:CPBP family intramembrane glutamic endopeptidase n=1 Tax=Nesterenkonia alba TaxID=515814 RepID=UPI0003B5A6AF|nr:type II CAAX endopeptidase family protein [Nesterenkonia alba]
MESQNSGDVEADNNAPNVDFFSSERVKRVTPVLEEEPTTAEKRPARGTRTWLEGSGTARAWNSTVLAYAAFTVGAAVVASVILRNHVSAPEGPILASLVLYLGMAIPVVIALRRSRPRGLLRFRWTDLIWGLGLGLLLRMIQGWLEVAAGSPGGLPSYPTLDGALFGATWLLTGLLMPVLLAPVVEEFLFRGVVLVTVYRTARRGLEAGILAITASAGTFVALHAVNGITRWDEPTYLFLVGVTCGALVLFTGRIWGAVLVHMTFNGIWVLLALAGTALSQPDFSL